MTSPTLVPRLRGPIILQAYYGIPLPWPPHQKKTTHDRSELLRLVQYTMSNCPSEIICFGTLVYFTFSWQSYFRSGAFRNRAPLSVFMDIRISWHNSAAIRTRDEIINITNIQKDYILKSSSLSDNFSSVFSLKIIVN